ncbi:MAG: hypothetical protein CVV39_03005 [Planctomycetes bacterium HGW-Planctomycetes-1]|nr:MAG: hypothetical protein CVV39_03005 [Planctomycetes bacterium HGW-Planctomycetes-1]
MKSIKSHIIIAVLAIIVLPVIICAEDYIHWDSNFEAIGLDNISLRNGTSENSAAVTLFISGNVSISADNDTESAYAQLHNASGDTLLTEYKLKFDGTGSGGKTGANNTEYAEYDSFLSSAVNITYVPDDNDVAVTLWVRASNHSNELADSGQYTATQTLTVTWGGN